MLSSLPSVDFFVSKNGGGNTGGRGPSVEKTGEENTLRGKDPAGKNRRGKDRSPLVLRLKSLRIVPEVMVRRTQQAGIRWLWCLVRLSDPFF